MLKELEGAGGGEALALGRPNGAEERREVLKALRQRGNLLQVADRTSVPVVNFLYLREEIGRDKKDTLPQLSNNIQ